MCVKVDDGDPSGRSVGWFTRTTCSRASSAPQRLGGKPYRRSVPGLYVQSTFSLGNMLIQLITSENNAGRYGARAGQGPAQLLASGLVARLEAGENRVEVIPAAPRDPFPTEVASAFTTAAALAKQVRAALRQRRFPLVLAGNCLASLGVVAGSRPERRGMIWIDPVGDLERPQTTRSGVLDRMALTIILGHAWQGMAGDIPGFTPLDPEQMLLIGGDEVDPEDASWAGEMALPWLKFSAIQHNVGAFEAAIERLKDAADRIHLHIDLRSIATGAHTSEQRLEAAALLALVRQVKSGAVIASATLASYDPASDITGERRRAAIEIIEALVAS